MFLRFKKQLFLNELLEESKEAAGAIPIEKTSVQYFVPTGLPMDSFQKVFQQVLPLTLPLAHMGWDEFYAVHIKCNSFYLIHIKWNPLDFNHIR